MKDFPSIPTEEAAFFLRPTFLQTPEGYKSFVHTILGFYEAHGRQFVWRETSDPYRILLSEVMLQQTQTSRVIPKYELFLSLWPTLKTLAEAPLDELLYHWKGLGYNRRALNLRKSAMASEKWGWRLPKEQAELLSLPGVGKATAAAIGAFSYQERTIYLETNIRRVLLYCFYPDQEGVKDKELELLLAHMVQMVEDPKAWYYALMDFGVLLKSLIPNANVRSAHYTKQAKFENSNRQIRGQLIHLLADTGAKEQAQVIALLSHFEQERILYCLEQLEKEGFVEETEGRYRIAKA